ncbi:hypothetical protein AXX17_ATUG04370 [Arabidopsis thaliana]|uniref:SAM-dependent MTase RsmB/NOP-type domain-containing protein n=1 Tax=Arabidopsis thaliana TaxID=3702 RepID=A0A178U8X9_ARATH|nr:hypothetical protein AXX17_ATUG04370 [Arabidopsis thaliana]
MRVPEAFAKKMKSLLGDEAEAFFASYDKPKTTGLRMNLLKAADGDLGDLPGEPVKGKDCIPWAPGGYYTEESDRPGKHPYYDAGLYYIQEPSAMVPAELLDVRPGHRVLDLCAAPGGKSTQLAAKLHGQGVLVTNDNAGERTKALAKNIERAGVRNAVVTNEEPKRLADQFGAYFDRVLVDAPCSGEGMFRKDDDMARLWQSDWPERYAAMQDEIMREAARLIRPGGQLVYSTCTFSPIENEGTIARFLAAHGEFEVVPVASHADWGFAPGRPEWLTSEELAGISAEQAASLAGTVRLWPHLVRGEGHYAALLRRTTGAEEVGTEQTAMDSDLQSAHSIEVFHVKSESAANQARVGSKAAKRSAGIRQDGRTGQQLRPVSDDNDVLAKYESFTADSLIQWQLPGRLLVRGDYVYAHPANLPELKGLKVIRQGWLLGVATKHRFEPSQALAMGLRKQQARRSIDLASADQETLRYLRGETLQPDASQIVGPDGLSATGRGWTLSLGRAEEGVLMKKTMRLDKMLGNLGYGTRSGLKLLVKQGAVTVNGVRIKDSGMQIDPYADEVYLDEEKIVYRDTIYVMLHKPAGYVSATEDKRDKTVLDLLPDDLAVFAPFPVGRLDKDTEGLLLLTNDGKLSHELLSPRKHVPKTYRAIVAGDVGESDAEAFQAGVTLDDGYVTMPAVLRVLTKTTDNGLELEGEDSASALSRLHHEPSLQTNRAVYRQAIMDGKPISWIELSIREGKYHQVKRMFESVGKQVLYLQRVAMGPLPLDKSLSPDGTLLNDDHELTPRVAEAVRKAAELGAEIVLCTGRGSQSALTVLSQLGLTGTVITHNGASVVDSLTREVLYEKAIASEEVERYLELSKERAIHFDMNTAFELYVSRLDEETSAMYERMLVTPIQRSESDGLPDRMVKISLFADKEALDALQSEWQHWDHGLQAIRSGDFFMDLQHLDASKGIALANWAQSRSIPREEVLAIGNYYNDIGMLQFAGCGVAMGNSPDEVKAAADEVTVSNNEDGVAVVLKEKLGLSIS